MDGYVLETYDRAGKGSLVPVSRYPFHIGRGAENDLVLPHSSVSRQHASIDRLNTGLGIMDHNSRNGVFVNEKRVPAMDMRPLCEGDLLLIGRIKLKLLNASAPNMPAFSEEPQSTEFFSHRESWDPIQTLSGVLPREGSSVLRKEWSDKWQRMLRNLLEAPLPKDYDPILDTIEESLPFDRCFLILFENGSPERTKFLASRSRDRLPSQAPSQVFVSRDILRRVAASREAVVLTKWDRNFEPTQSFIMSGASSALCVPLVARGSVIGVLYLDRLTGTQCFSRNDIELLGPIAGLVALKIENIQLLESYLAAQLDRRDMEIAEEIQRSLFPREPPRLSGYSVDTHTRPCRQVGGDYLDFFVRGEDEILLAIGDVSGKGLSAALYMVGVLTTLRSCATEDLGVEALMARLESYVRATFRADHFLTLLLGTLERKSGRLVYANAGHLPPLIFGREGEVRELDGSDPALNIVPCEEFRRFQCELAPEELLLLYTDGLIEENNSRGEQFGPERLISCVKSHRKEDLPSIRKEILSAVDAFIGDEGLRDDVSLILVRREEG